MMCFLVSQLSSLLSSLVSGCKIFGVWVKDGTDSQPVTRQFFPVDVSSEMVLTPKASVAVGTVASSSSSSPAAEWKYDVFLSFRGPDTRRSITSDLYYRLQNKRGITTFMDDRDLQVGDAVSPVLLKAIEESRFAIVVLSEKYAFSTWCLEELTKICECMKEENRIFPVFYNVEPFDVRHRKRSFEEAFNKHESSGRHPSQEVQRWKDTLNKVANFSGWDTKNFKTDRELVDAIVDYVCSKIQPIKSEWFDFHNRIGGIGYRNGLPSTLSVVPGPYCGRYLVDVQAEHPQKHKLWLVENGFVHNLWTKSNEDLKGLPDIISETVKHIRPDGCILRLKFISTPPEWTMINGQINYISPYHHVRIIQDSVVKPAIVGNNGKPNQCIPWMKAMAMESIKKLVCRDNSSSFLADGENIMVTYYNPHPPESCDFFTALLRKEVDCTLATSTWLEHIERDEKYEVFSDSDLEYESNNDHEAPDSDSGSSDL